ncbi:MAG: Nif3-like dinuclear metal center hexameric protein [Syntrophomonadaceae bacterium]|nr:Nif3-like dinuclear metal center hexameric protein [Syntrophomonadaceae bacterium]MDD3022501.1 Nif3-like dinuclear metal center hexameric protein [Syntrophomonadaceae bacterium]
MSSRVKDIIGIMEDNFPLWLAESWDNCGLQIGSYEAMVNRIVVALDLDEEIIKFAIDQKADMIITHHPLFFQTIKSINYSKSMGRMIKNIVNAGINVYSAHTNLDAAEHGLNQYLAELLGLTQIMPLDTDKQEELYKLVVFVPISHTEELRNIINSAGAGYIGAYSDCSFRVQGTGTFRPREGSNPFIGQIGELEEVDEYRLETVVFHRDLQRMIKLIEEVHPYEEVAYDIYRLNNKGRIFSLGRKGCWTEKMSLQECAEQIKRSLKLDSVRMVGDPKRSIKTVAVVSGSGSSLIGKVLKQKIDLFVTGDLKYHEARDAEAQGLAIIDAGHQGSEEIVVPLLCNLLQKESKIKGFDLELIPAFVSPCIKVI